MSSEDGGESPPSDLLQETVPVVQTEQRISYKREFLLSLADCEACKKLPVGCDPSVLSGLQFEGTSTGVLERHRSQGGLQLQGFRRTDQGRADGLGGYTRGGTGRWDTRSNGSASSDKDDVPERELFAPDRRPGNQFRHNWQQNEHDGLLGSGASARPPGFGGVGTYKSRGGGPYQLNKTSEPYQPPRSYKAGTYSRKDYIDHINDETFGSFETPGEDRTEEERKRRAEFENERKERHKANQERQTVGKHGDDIMALLQNPVKKELPTDNTEKKGQPSVPSSTVSRPAVPPGFSGAVGEKKCSLQSYNGNIKLEAQNAASETNFPIDGQIRDQEEESISFERDHTSMIGSTTGASQLHSVSAVNCGEDMELDPRNPKTNECSRDDFLAHHLSEFEPLPQKVSTTQDISVSALEKFFANSLSTQNVVGQNNQGFVEEVPISSASESSKFAHWFVEEDTRHGEDLPSKNLLSMLVKHENATQENHGQDAGPTYISGEDIPGSSLIKGYAEPVTAVPGAAFETLVPYRQVALSSPAPVVLTCEDLEHSILAEANVHIPPPQHHVQNEREMRSETNGKMANADDQASHLLLSLLRSTKSKDSLPTLQSADESVFSDNNFMMFSDASKPAVTANADTSAPGKSLTLEALFGAAFMKELHSTEAPVSERNAAAGGPASDLPYSETLQSSNGDNWPAEHKRPNHTQEGPAVSIPMTRVEYDHIGAGASEIQLPEEETLLSLVDSFNTQPPDSSSRRTLNQDLDARLVNEISYNFPDLISQDAEQIRSRRNADMLFPRGYNADPGSDNMHYPQSGRVPSQALHPMKDARPSAYMHPDHFATRTPQAPFMHPDAFRHEPNCPFPSPVPQHAFDGPGSSFNPATHAMLQQMAASGNFPPQHQLQGLPRGFPVAEPMQRMPGHESEFGIVNNFHPRPQQLNHEYRMRLPGPPAANMRGIHPESYDRLMQMELARLKQLHPPAMGGQMPGIFGPELDMNYRYR